MLEARVVQLACPLRQEFEFSLISISDFQVSGGGGGVGSGP